jgi:hypothetical protein
MQWSDISFTPSTRTLRQFAGIWVLFFGGLACWHGLVGAHTSIALVLAVLAVTVGPLGLIWPRAIRWIYVGWMVLAFPIGWVISRVILALLFYGLFTPLGQFFKLIGRDALARRYHPGVDTYWAPKPTAIDMRSYYHQS